MQVCQLTDISDMGRKNSFINNLFQVRVKILRKSKRRFIFIKNRVFKILKLKSFAANKADFDHSNIQAGDKVRIKSKKEIENLLDEWNKYQGCLFIDEMYEYCGKTYKVLKIIDHFFDEARQKMYRCKDTVILDGVVCSGRQRLYKVGCDRQCFFFWSIAWLEKVIEG